MKVLYDETNDILDVVFVDTDGTSGVAGYELDDGIILHVSAEWQPIQLTVVNYRRLTALPSIHFQGLARHSKDIRPRLIEIVTSPPVSAFLRLDSQSLYGHLVNPSLLEVCGSV